MFNFLTNLATDISSASTYHHEIYMLSAPCDGQNNESINV